VTAPWLGLPPAIRPRAIRLLISIGPTPPEPPGPARLIRAVTAPGSICPEVGWSVGQVVGVRPTALELPGLARLIGARTPPGPGRSPPIRPRTVRPPIRPWAVRPPVSLGPPTLELPSRARPVATMTAPGLIWLQARWSVSLLFAVRPTAPRMPGPARRLGTATPPSLSRPPRPNSRPRLNSRPTAVRPRAVGHRRATLVTRLGPAPTASHIAGISKIARVIPRRPRTQVRPEPGQPARRELGVRPRTASAARTLLPGARLPWARRPGARRPGTTPVTSLRWASLRWASRARVALTPATRLTRLTPRRNIRTRNNVTRVGAPSAALRPATARIRPASVVGPTRIRLSGLGIRPVPLAPALMAPPAVLPLRCRGLRLGTG
jgi:hypothetical protein